MYPAMKKMVQTVKLTSWSLQKKKSVIGQLHSMEQSQAAEYLKKLGIG